ncbi:MAG: beta-N-acetylhexosaminidase [Acutalibacteraceae bacterium]
MTNLIPVPEKVKVFEGTFSFAGEKIILDCSNELIKVIPAVERAFGMEFKQGKNPELSFVYSSGESDESYSLEISQSGITVYAKAYAGAFYGLQSLTQLYIIHGGSFPLMKITCDEPKYKWRGLHLDESRHFFGKATVKKLLDFMALYKLNRFHWHLTDDQGWRIEIEKYPLLTEIGSKRKGSQLKNWNSKEMENIPHEGFYTKEDIKEIIAYAKDRCIEIVPEIDFPAHCASAIASYNHLACRKIECEVPDFYGWIIPQSRGIKNWNRPLCLGSDEAVQFALDVIDEVAELFPYKYFHVGGDEAPTNEWKACPDCQKRIKDNGLKNEVALQGWFTNRVNAHLKEKGKIMIGWNEVLASSIVDRDIVCQYWTPKKDRNVFTHLEKGGQVILSWHKYFYFDMLHSYCGVEDVYNFTSKTAGIKPKWEKDILGVEAETWTEWIDEENELFFKIWNRTLALSECAWSYDGVKNYKDFCERLQKHKIIADKKDIYYGSDEYTMHKAKSKKARLCKKQGISINDYDCEYELDKLKR